MSAWQRVTNGTPAVGACAERHRQISEEDIARFTELSGDRNPLHYNRELAEASIFGGLIAQGGVTSAILNALVAEDLPGPGTVFLNVNWKFTKPVFIGDQITGRVEVTQVRSDKPICHIVTTVRNQLGQLCLDGTAMTYTVPLEV